MNGLESHEAAPLSRILVSGSTEWLRTAANALETDGDEDISVEFADFESRTGTGRQDRLESLTSTGAHEQDSFDCLLTDDLTVVRKFDHPTPPTLVASENPTSDVFDTISDLDDVDLITRSDATSPEILRYRLEQVSLDRRRKRPRPLEPVDHHTLSSHDVIEDSSEWGETETETADTRRILGTLESATERLLAAESEQEAAEYVVDVITELTATAGAVCYRFDERENELVPTATSAGLQDSIGTPQRIQPTAGVVWDVFVDGTPRIADGTGSIPTALDAGVESALYVPLRTHGVLAVLSSEPHFDYRTIDLVQLLGTTAETALDRLDRSQTLEEREHDLDRQNARLESIDRAAQLRSDLTDILLPAGTRSEIEQGVCDRLVGIDDCLFAWIGEPDASGDRVRPRTTAGSNGGYLDTITVPIDDTPMTEPTGRCVDSGEPITIQNVGTAVRTGDWPTEALSRDFQSVLSVPLVHDGFLYGVLSVYVDRHNGFDDPLRSTLGELGQTIAYTIDAIQRKNARESTEVTEIDIETNDCSELSALTTLLETQLSLEGFTPQSDGSTIAVFELDLDCDPASDTLDEIDEIDGIEDPTLLDGRTDRTLLQVRLVDPFLGTIVETQGGQVRTLTADESATRATIDVPPTVDVRSLLAGISSHGPAVSLLARHDRTRSDDRPLEGLSTEPLLDDLTDRQREVIQTAYYGGYFEWPRTATGEEIATSLDISPPAFHNHVRTVQRKLFTSLFEAGSSGNG